jgi:hypothetical protein
MFEHANIAIVVAWARDPNDLYAIGRILRGIDTVAVNAEDAKLSFPFVWLLPILSATRDLKMRGNM